MRWVIAVLFAFAIWMAFVLYVTLAFARALPFRRISPRNRYHELSLLADKRTKVFARTQACPPFVARVGARGGEKGVQVLFLGIGVIFGVAGRVVLILGRAPRVHHESFGGGQVPLRVAARVDLGPPRSPGKSPVICDPEAAGSPAKARALPKKDPCTPTHTTAADESIDPSARKGRGPQDDKVVRMAGRLSLGPSLASFAVHHILPVPFWNLPQVNYVDSPFLRFDLYV
jgi:hypothetical protein